MITGNFKFNSTDSNIQLSDVIINNSSGSNTYPISNEYDTIVRSTNPDLLFDRISDFHDDTLIASFQTSSIGQNDGRVYILEKDASTNKFVKTGFISQNTNSYPSSDFGFPTISYWNNNMGKNFIWPIEAKINGNKNILAITSRSLAVSNNYYLLLEIYAKNTDNSWSLIKKRTYNNTNRNNNRIVLDLNKTYNTIVLTHKKESNCILRIFNQNEGGTNNWGEIHSSTESNSFGNAISSFGDWLAISEAKHSIHSRIYFYNRNTGGTNKWGSIGDPIWDQIYLNNKYFGTNILFLDTERIIVAENISNQANSLYYYKKNPNNIWNLVKKFSLPQQFSQTDDKFGNSLASYTQSGYIILFVGAYNANSSKGIIYKYELNLAIDNEFLLRARLEASDGLANHQFSRQLYFSNNILVTTSEKDTCKIYLFNDVNSTDTNDGFVSINYTQSTTNNVTNYVIDYLFDNNRLAPTNGLKINNNSNPITITDFDNIPLVKTGEQFKFFNGEITTTSISVPTIRDGTSLQSIFESSNITNLNATNWDTSKVTNISKIFKNCNSLVSLNLSSWDTSIVTNMSSAFENCKKLASLDINNWSTGLVENFSSMFENCLLLTPDLTNFVFSSNITNINKMIANCKLPASQYSSFLRKLADSDMPKDLTLGYTGHVRLDNSQTNAAYTKLVSNDTTGYNLTFTDGGSYTQEEISKFTSDPLPDDLIIMNSTTNGTEINISNTMYISDLGGIEYFPVHFTTMYSLTINLPQNDRIQLTGIVDMISPDFFKIFDGGDNNATLIYNSLDASNQNLNLTSSGKKLHFQLSLDDNASGSGIFIKVILLDDPNINNIIATWGSILDIPEIQSNQEVEIRTSNINDNTQIELTILNSNGQTVITRTGTITSNIATISFNPSDNLFDNLDTGKYTFKASLNYEGSNISKDDIEFDIDKNLPVIGNFTYKWGNDSNILDESNKELDGSLNITFSNIINNSTYELFINDTKIANGTISDSNTNNLDFVISKSFIGDIDEYNNQFKFILRNNNNSSEKIDNFSALFLREAPICFLENAIVHTDQGKIKICELNSNYSINGLKIIKITKFLNKDDHMILFKKHSIGMNKPCVDTPVSRLHGIFINDFNMVTAYKLINNRNIFPINIGKKYVYNVLLKYHSKMLVNNMLVETLNPENKIAKLYINQYKNQSKIAYEKKINEGCIIS